MTEELKLPLPVKVKLIGKDGNAFMILGRVTEAMKKKGYGDLVEQFREEAMSGDYNKVLQTCLKWVECS